MHSDSSMCLRFSELMRGGSPLTSTDCWDLATLSVKLTVCFCPKPEITFSFCCGSNPLPPL